jgi:hypothetical protein
MQDLCLTFKKHVFFALQQQYKDSMPNILATSPTPIIHFERGGYNTLPNNRYNKNRAPYINITCTAGFKLSNTGTAGFKFVKHQYRCIQNYDWEIHKGRLEVFDEYGIRYIFY